MANKKLTDFTTQVTLNTSTRLYGVPYSGTGAFTDTQVPITVLFDNTTFTGTTKVTTLAATTAVTVNSIPVVTTTDTQTLTNKTLTTPIISTISNTGTLTLPTSTDTLVGRATTDTLTNKTITAAALSGTFSGTPTFSGNVTFTSTITPSQTAGIVGTTTNNNANAGSVGEFVSASPAGISISNGVVTNITSISLTAGDWDVSGNVYYLTGAGDTAVGIKGSVSTTSATHSAIPLFSSWVGSAGPGNELSTLAPEQRLSLSATTTVYLVATGFHSGGTLTAQGVIRARRVR